MKNKLDLLMDKLDNPLFTTIHGEDLELMAKEYEEDEK
jgi:hypothetical protein